MNAQLGIPTKEAALTSPPSGRPDNFDEATGNPG